MPTTYTYPSTTAFTASKFEIGLRSNVLMTTSSHTGSVQTIEMPGSRWVVTMSYDIQAADGRAEVEAFWAKVRGQVNRVALWHLRRPTPRGTATTSGIQVNATVSAGLSTLVFKNGTNGTTYKQGDMFSVNSELKMIIADTTFNGSSQAQVDFTPPLRAQAAINTSIVLSSPTALFVPTQQEVMVPYEGYIGGSFSVSLVEVFA
jgi:hypothetical protein